MTTVDRRLQLALKGAEETVRGLFVAEINRQVRRVEQDCSPDGSTRWIDGREGAPVEAVGPFGTALFEFRYLSEVLVFALKVLWTNSPVDRHPKANTIVFREVRQLLIDGVLRADLDLSDTSPELSRLLRPVPRGAEVIITDTDAYARMLENGWSSQAPNGVYKISCATVRRKFGAHVSVDFRWIDSPSGKGRLPAMVIREIL